ncbi:helix-turn-helix domain-containing protein [Peribacillus cavernae]|nr:helix-turn-helix domain-containing protein [Peribacillus cavernae]
MWHKQNYSRSIFIYALLGVTIPILLYLCFSSSYFIFQGNKQVIQSNLLTIRQVKERIDAELEYVSKSTRNVVSDDSLNEGIYNKKLRDDQAQLNEIHNKLKELQKSLKDAYSVDLYVPSQKLLISSENGVKKSLSSDTLDLYRNVQAIRKPDWGYSKQQNTIDVLTYYQPVPVITNFPQAYLAVHIYERALSSTFELEEYAESGEIFIINTDGKIISHSDKSKLGNYLFDDHNYKKITRSSVSNGYFEDDNRKETFFYGKSLSSDLITVYRIPNSILFTHHQAASLYLVVAGALIILSFIYTYFFTRRLAKPISQYIKQTNLSLDGYQKDEWKLINQDRNRLVQQVTALDMWKKNNLYRLRNFFLLKLISRDINHSNRGINTAALQAFNLDYQSKIQVLVLEMQDLECNDAFKENDNDLLFFAIDNIINEILVSQNLKGFLVQTMDNTRTIIILQLHKNLVEMELQSIANQLSVNIKHSLQTYLKMVSYFGIGRMHESWDDLAKSYQEAIVSLNYRIINPRQEIIDFEQLESTKLFSYPYVIENRILKELKNNNRATCSVLFDEFVEEIAKKCTSITQLHHAYYMLYTSLYRTMDELGDTPTELLIQKPVKEIFYLATQQQIKKWFNNELFPYLFEQVSNLSEDKGIKTVEYVKRYIQDHIELDLTLTSVAEEVNLSSPYLSKLFKKVSGESFIQYITKMKIERSKELLIQSNLTISEIAKAIGYSERTFGRVFKDTTGITPNNFRLQYKTV